MDHPKETAANGTFSKILVARQEKLFFVAALVLVNLSSHLLFTWRIYTIYKYIKLTTHFFISWNPPCPCSWVPHRPNIPKRHGKPGIPRNCSYQRWHWDLAIHKSQEKSRWKPLLTLVDPTKSEQELGDANRHANTASFVYLMNHQSNLESIDLSWQRTSSGHWFFHYSVNTGFINNGKSYIIMNNQY